MGPDLACKPDTASSSNKGRGHSFVISQACRLSCLRLALVKLGRGFTSSCPTRVLWLRRFPSSEFTIYLLPFLPSSAEFSPARPLCNATALLLGQCEIAGQPRRVGMTMAGHKRIAN